MQATMNRWIFLALATLPFTAGAVVIRDDVDDARYQIDASAFPALADMPGEGHGVLIAPRWVLTAAHAAPMEGRGATITINGNGYGVERVFLHPGYRRMPEALGKEAMATGSASKIHAFLAASDDIALIRLAAPVSDVPPVALYRGADEVTQVAALIGRGATGNGATGLVPGGPPRITPPRARSASPPWGWRPAGRIVRRCGEPATRSPAATRAISGTGLIRLRRAFPLKACSATATAAARW